PRSTVSALGGGGTLMPTMHAPRTTSAPPRTISPVFGSRILAAFKTYDFAGSIAFWVAQVITGGRRLSIRAAHPASGCPCVTLMWGCAIASPEQAAAIDTNNVQTRVEIIVAATSDAVVHYPVPGAQRLEENRGQCEGDGVTFTSMVGRRFNVSTVIFETKLV